MNDVVLSCIHEGLQNLDGKATDEANRDALKVVVLDEFVQVNTQQFENDAEMFPKQDVIFDSDDVVLVVAVVLFEKSQNLDFNCSLVLELLLVTDDL